MSQIKLCGMTRLVDIEAVNTLKPEYIGFVFWERSKRNVTKEEARMLKDKLDSKIKVVGVFVDEELSVIEDLLNDGIIDLAQLHGQESEDYIKALQERTKRRVIKAFTIRSKEDVARANASSADMVLVDSGKGSGMTFSWELLKGMKRPYFLAGGLNTDNIYDALEQLSPFAVDVSSGIETDGVKDPEKMALFIQAVRP